VTTGSRWPLAAAAAGLGALAVLFLALASWQWRRAEASRALIERFADAGAADALETPPWDAADETQRYRRVRLRGRFAEDRQFLLDNIVANGRPGYHVLTPFRPRDSERWLIVNRGWVPAAGDRRSLPDVAVAGDERIVTGRLERLLRPGLRLGDAVVVGGDETVAVVAYPTAADLQRLLGAPVGEWQVLLDAAEPDGYLREWRAAALGPERHLVYAGQWLLFALLAVTIACGILWRTYGGRRA
jgi:surfeit locus 1 family protein